MYKIILLFILLPIIIFAQIKTTKVFNTKELALRVDAYGKAKVDSFKIKYVINREIFTPSPYNPRLIEKKQPKVRFGEGLFIGSALTFTGIGIANKQYKEVALGWGGMVLIYLIYKLI